MTNFVTKKDGERVPFDMEKIKHAIMSAADDTELSDEEKDDAVEQVCAAVMMNLETREEVSSQEVKDAILSELDVTFPAIGEAWRKYEESKSM